MKHTTQNVVCCTTATEEELRTAIANRIPISGLQCVVTHKRAHLDELLAMFFIHETPEGQKLFPGKSSFGCFTEKELAPFIGPDNFYLALSRGYLLVGTGNGPFDEHVDRKNNASCAGIMAEYLGLKNTKYGRMVYSRILDYVNFEDVHGNQLYKQCKEFANQIQPALLADNIKRGWHCVEAGLKDDATLVAEVFGFLRNEIGYQSLFVQAVEEFKHVKKAGVQIVAHTGDVKNRKPILLVVESDNQHMPAVVRKEYSTSQSERLCVLVMVNSKGQVYISSQYGVPLTNLVAVLRIMLAEAKQMPIPDVSQLRLPETIPGLEELYYHVESNSLLNGSLSQPDTPGLIRKHFTMEKLMKGLMMGMDPNRTFGFIKSKTK